MADCPATVKVHDDRWGVFVNSCELDEGHSGDHRAAYTACDPVAYLGWSGSARTDGQVDEPR
jgi:hypothetical protein